LFVEFFGWVRDGLQLRNRPYRRFIVMVLITILPMFPVLLVKDKLEELFSNTLFVGCALLVTALVLLLSERAPRLHKDAGSAGWLDAFLVGCAQAVAVVPGISRSGSTICAGLFRGFSRDFAVRFAFIMSLPVVFGANLLEVSDAIAQAEVSSGIPIYLYILGIAVAMVSGLLAIRLIRLVTNKGHPSLRRLLRPGRYRVHYRIHCGTDPGGLTRFPRCTAEPPAARCSPVPAQNRWCRSASGFVPVCAESGITA
jgi:undecaprenyl-diphosphatase